MKYRKVVNFIYIMFFIFFLFITLNYKDTIQLPTGGEQKISRTRVEEFFDANIKDEELKAGDISRYVILFIWLTHLSVFALQDKSINNIKRFLKSAKNKVFVIFIFVLFIILKRIIFSLDYYTLPMIFLNSITATVFMFYFINSKQVNEAENYK